MSSESQPETSPRPQPGQSETAVVLMAAAGWLGASLSPALLHTRWTAVAAGIVIAICLARRVPAGLILAGFLLCSHLGARAAADYQPVAPGPLSGPVTALSDPRPFGAGTRIVMRLPSGARIESTGYGRAAAELSQIAIGEQVMVEGLLKPIGQRGWLRTRHISGLATIDSVEHLAPPGPFNQIPDFFRERIANGASTMAPDRRSLYLGLVIGDDRAQTLGQQLRFRASGLTHLLAVSGQNVAFVLAVFRPMLAMFGLRTRFVAILMVLIVFALITRLEPSVLRATATASIAAWAALTGRERSGLRVLALAVMGLICLDPFLVDAVGFQLSVAASGGILIAQPTIQRRLPGPEWLTGPLSTTVAAQIGVSPLLAHYFGPVSVASIPANLLAGWAAAVTMTVGLTTGVLAGLLPPAAARIVQLPVEALLWWIEAVATWHSRFPAPRIGPLQAMGLAAVAAAIRSGVAPKWARIAATVLVAAALLAAIPRASSPAICGPGIAWYPSGAGVGSNRESDEGSHTESDEESHRGPNEVMSVLVLTGSATDRSIEACADSGIRSVDVLVVERGNASTARLVAALDQVMSVGRIVAPPQHRVIGARRQLDELRLETVAGTLVAQPTIDGMALSVSIVPLARR